MESGDEMAGKFWENAHRIGRIVQNIIRSKIGLAGRITLQKNTVVIHRSNRATFEALQSRLKDEETVRSIESTDTDEKLEITISLHNSVNVNLTDINTGELHHWIDQHHPKLYENYLESLVTGSLQEFAEFLDHKDPKILREFKQQGQIKRDQDDSRIG